MDILFIILACILASLVGGAFVWLVSDYLDENHARAFAILVVVVAVVAVLGWIIVFLIL